MCIIMYAPKGGSIAESKIRTAFKNNSDGAGVMWYDRGGTVRYKKGFKRVDELVAFFNLISPEVPRAIHCRIATSGRVSAKTCHPFPIVANVEDMGVAEGIGKKGCLMHNGIFSKYTPKDGMKSEYSDTMFFTSRVIYPIVKSHMIFNKGVDELLSDMTSRVLLFLPKGRVIKYGTWYKDDEENFYASNYTYENYYSYYGYGYYGGTYSNYSKTNPYYKDSDDWWKSRTPTCTVTSTTPANRSVVITSTANNAGSKLAQVKKKSEIVKPEYFFNIQLSAADEKEAEDLFYDFLDTYYGYIVDCDDYTSDAYLIPIDKGIWEFWVESYEDLDKLQKIQHPYMINYFEKYTEDGKSEVVTPTKPTENSPQPLIARPTNG